MQDRQPATTFFAKEGGFANPVPPRTKWRIDRWCAFGSSVGFGVAGSLAEILFTRQFGEAPPKEVLLDSIGR